MKIGIIGSGFVGTQFGKALVKAGHQVMIASRTPDSDKMRTLQAELGVEVGTPQQTLEYSEVVAIAMAWAEIPAMVASVQGWQGKIIIDMNNRFGSSESPSHELARLTGGRVVKTLNSIGAEHYTAPQVNGQAASMLMAGDDVAAKQTVAQLLSDIGFEPLDAGDLNSAAAHLDHLAAIWVHLAFRTPLGRGIAIKVLR